MKKISTKTIKLAIPKKGRLRSPSIKLLHKAGYVFPNDPELLHATTQTGAIDILFLRTDDIPTLVAEGAIDVGITGSDNVLETKSSELKEILPLGYGHCQLCLAGPQKPTLRRPFDLTELNEKKIATSFPQLTKQFLRAHRIKAHMVEIAGSLEIMVALRLADAIVDIVETGQTLKNNGLYVYETLGHYYTALYGKKAILADQRIVLLRKRLASALLAQNYSILEYNISKALLKKAEIISPGFDSPTISHLDDSTKVAVKIFVKKSEVLTLMDRLEALGATAIFETAINNCRL